MFNFQEISHPFGISVFGSSIIRVAPDIASLNFSVSRIEERPREAFQQTHQGVRQARHYLAQAGVEEVQASRINLSESFNRSKFEGYRASVNFHVLIYDLERLEDILINIVENGINKINSVSFQTSRLKEVRAEARRRAVAAAREKAELYCDAAGVQLGRVIHIEDMNPDQVRGRTGQAPRSIEDEDEQVPRAFDPGSIIVGAAVMIAYDFKRA